MGGMKAHSFFLETMGKSGGGETGDLHSPLAGGVF